MLTETKPMPRYPRHPGSLPSPRPTGRKSRAANVKDPDLEEEVYLSMEPEESQVEGEDLNELEPGEPLELDRAELAAELSEDPVRLYFARLAR